MSPKLLLWFHPDVRKTQRAKAYKIYSNLPPSLATKERKKLFFLTTVMQIKKCHMSLNQHWGDNFE